jgi:hypothetical protein
VTGPAASVDSEIALFSSTTGKIIKRATTTGLLKATSGVIAAASAGTDYVASITSTSAALANDVQLAVSNTWYDGPSVSLAAGTWLVNAHVTVVRTATTAITYFSRISDGTTHYASTQAYQGSVANHSDSMSLSAIVTLAGTTTIKIQTTSNAGATTALMKAATTANGSGNNATQITAIKVA